MRIDYSKVKLITEDIAFPEFMVKACVLVGEQEQEIKGYAVPSGANTYLYDAEKFTLQVLAEQGENAVVLRLGITNKSNAPVRLRSLAFDMDEKDAMVFYGAPKEWYGMGGNLKEVLPSQNELRKKYCLGRGDEITGLSEELTACDGKYRGGMETVTFGKKDGTGLIFTPWGTAEAYIHYNAYVDNGNVHFRAESKMHDVLLEPGETRFGQDLFVGYGDLLSLYQTALNCIAKTHGKRTLRGPKFGWCSWYDKEQNITEQSVTETLNKVLEMKDEFKIEFFQIDDGYQVVNGEWEPNAKFPNKFQDIVARLKNAGIHAGLWLAPALIHQDSKIAKAHPEVIAKKADGSLAKGPVNWGGNDYWADVTQPTFLQFVKETFANLRKIGFDFFKIDFNGVEGRLFDEKLTDLQAKRMLYKTYREAIGEDCFLVSCAGFVDRGTIGYVDANRIGADLLPVWESYHGAVLKNNIPNLVRNSLVNGVFYAADPDVTYLRSKLTQDEFQIWHSMAGLTGGMQMLSDPLQNRTQEELRLFQINCPPCKETALPAFYGSENISALYGFTVCRAYGNFGVYLVTNMQDTEQDICVQIPKLNDLKSAFHVWSFWDEAYLGEQENGFVLKGVKPHSAKLLRFTPVTETPELIGSTFHIGCGTNEVENVTVSEQKMEIDLNTDGAKDGKLFVSCASEPKVFCDDAECKVYYQNGIAEMDVKRHKANTNLKITLKF